VQQQGQRRQGQRGVSFAGGADIGSSQTVNDEVDDAGAEDLVRKLWAEIGAGAS